MYTRFCFALFSCNDIISLECDLLTCIHRDYLVDTSSIVSRWRHQMEPFSALLLLYVGNSQVTDEYPSQRPVTRSFDISLVCILNKRLSTQSWGWWLETPLRSLWRHCNVIAPVSVVWTWDVWMIVLSNRNCAQQMGTVLKFMSRESVRSFQN